jgi:C-terminal processing protease CtpA/Prc
MSAIGSKIRWAGLLLFLGLAAVVAIQQRTIQHLRLEREQAATSLTPVQDPSEAKAPKPDVDQRQQEELARLRRENQDLLRLRNEVHQLREQVQETERAGAKRTDRQNEMQQLTAQNQHLLSLLSQSQRQASGFPTVVPVGEPPAPVVQSYIGVALGGMPVDPNTGLPDPKTQGVMINNVYPDSAAAEAQLRNGDIIVRIDGQSVTNIAQARQTIGSHSPGQRVLLELVRDGLPTQVSVVTRPPPPR